MSKNPFFFDTSGGYGDFVAISTISGANKLITYYAVRR